MALHIISLTHGRMNQRVTGRQAIVDTARELLPAPLSLHVVRIIVRLAVHGKV